LAASPLPAASFTGSISSSRTTSIRFRRGGCVSPDGFAADPEFPRYADARFDPDAGHVAPPSFYLASRGRSVAYRYVGDATRVRRGDYAVTGWVRPDRLARGRATLSAYYLDWEGQYVPGTQRFGRLIGSDPADASTGRGGRLGADPYPLAVRAAGRPFCGHYVLGGAGGGLARGQHTASPHRAS
jgi:hypothetical protein